MCHLSQAGALFSYMRTQDYLSRGALFFSQKVDDLFLVVAVVTFKPAYAACKHQHSVVKIWQLIGGPLVAGGPPMVQLAQWIIRPCPL